MLFALAALVPAAYAADTSTTGGAGYGQTAAKPKKKKRFKRATRRTIDPTVVGAATPTPAPPTPGATAVIGPDGLAQPPVAAPPQVQQAILAANTIIGKPYV